MGVPGGNGNPIGLACSKLLQVDATTIGTTVVAYDASLSCMMVTSHAVLPHIITPNHWLQGSHQPHVPAH
jgi:hypothetical protein